ncbi:glycosyltransferase [Thermodesulfobacteriota bacterium]
MRISYLIHQFSRKHTSGVEQYCFNMACEMKRRGNDVSIFSYQYSNKNAKLQKGTYDYYFDDMLMREVYHNYMILKDAEKFEFYNPVIKDYIRAYFEKVKPDIVHILHLKNLSASVIDAAYEMNIPILFTPMDFWPLCPNFTLLRPDFDLCRGPFSDTPCQLCLGEGEETLGQKIADRKHQPLFERVKDRLTDSLVTSSVKKLVDSLASTINAKKHWEGIGKQLERKEFILRKCEKIKKILAPSEFIRDVLIENGYDQSQVEVLPLGYDITAPEDYTKVPSEKLRIGYIGTINKHKGPHLIIEALKGINSKNLELKIYGDFTRFHKYTHYVRNLAAHDKRISFKGSFRPERTDEIFSGLDLLVMPSLWYENMPTVIHSALRHKTPVITSSFGGLPEIIHHAQNGILFKRNDPDDLREKIEDILVDRSIVDKLKERITPPLSIAEHVDKLLTMFENYTFCDKV